MFTCLFFFIGALGYSTYVAIYTELGHSVSGLIVALEMLLIIVITIGIIKLLGRKYDKRDS